MKICYFGFFDREYSRNKVLISGLEHNGAKVLLCVSRKTGATKYLDLVKRHFAIRNEYDVMIVGFPGFQAVILAKLLTRKLVILDAFVSLYDSIVEDRQAVAGKSIRGRYYRLLDFISMRLADHILFDTNAHIDVVTKIYNLPRNKFSRIFVGTSDEVFEAGAESQLESSGHVLFYGTYIPLHGIEYIIRAAKLLEANRPDIKFRLIGNGQEKPKMISLAKSLKINNIEFVGPMSMDELLGEISEARVCLGIFGETHKAQNVIPNKVFECVALGKPLITADTPAIHEIFTDKQMALVPAANPEMLAAAIAETYDRMDEAGARARAARQRLAEVATPKILGKELLGIADRLIHE